MARGQVLLKVKRSARRELTVNEGARFIVTQMFVVLNHTDPPSCCRRSS
ncbi:hypothetical protein ACPOL_3303 [Acidisarcina polymorpha]|uniref:Uncharacterized protein n=1 Tax=Acidisarcina polymorpha TaxID=2211140 RepID=A0A2Z5G1B4_9BACT|nr:hypothetical protein ACPOL_3303 [Acidisarcina polymorpha]